MTQTFRLPYWCSSNGDGSVSVRFEKSLEAAERADEKQDEGWGESSAGYVEVKVENGKLFFKKYDGWKEVE